MGSTPLYILLVDDEQNILKALSRELREWSTIHGIQLLTAISAAEGLRTLAEKAPNTIIVVSDLRMPEMKGSDFLLSVHELYPDIVTILLTGYSEVEEIVKAVSAGIFSFMVKPWEKNYLISEINKAFEFGELKKQNSRYLKLMENELKWAGELQKTILQPNLPHSELVELRVSYRPLKNLFCGGDYYDVIALAKDRYLLLIGDVAGHGVRAAFITGILKAVIYPEYIAPRTTRDFSPAAFLGWLNNRMNFELRQTEGLIISFFAAVLDLGTKKLRYANAGQPHPYLIHDQTLLELPVSGPGLGFSGSTSYIEKEIAVKTGDTLNLFTDGLVEIEVDKEWINIQPQRLFSTVGYAPDYHRQLIARAIQESGGREFSDDVTLLTARIL
jgi:phosphoserine phosphatase RsbU/P